MHWRRPPVSVGIRAEPDLIRREPWSVHSTAGRLHDPTAWDPTEPSETAILQVTTRSTRRAAVHEPSGSHCAAERASPPRLVIVDRDLSRPGHLEHADRRRRRRLKTFVQQPRGRLADWRDFVTFGKRNIRRNGLAPPTKRQATRIGIQAPFEQRVRTIIIAMATPVVDHVRERIAHLAHRIEVLAVVAVGEHAARSRNRRRREYAALSRFAAEIWNARRPLARDAWLFASTIR